MPVFLLNLFGFVGKHWKPFLVGGIILAGLAFAYYKGASECAEKHEKKVRKEIQERFEELLREEERLEAIKRSLEEDRTRTPLNDKRDSCILSNDPYETDCLK